MPQVFSDIPRRYYVRIGDDTDFRNGRRRASPFQMWWRFQARRAGRRRQLNKRSGLPHRIQPRCKGRRRKKPASAPWICSVPALDSASPSKTRARLSSTTMAAISSWRFFPRTRTPRPPCPPPLKAKMTFAESGGGDTATVIRFARQARCFTRTATSRKTDTVTNLRAPVTRSCAIHSADVCPQRKLPA